MESVFKLYYINILAMDYARKNILFYCILFYFVEVYYIQARTVILFTVKVV